jgi:ubiquinone/menaquinone biosynthesis C-methylase UbiE
MLSRAVEDLPSIGTYLPDGTDLNSLDKWARWVLHRLFGGDPEQLALYRAYLAPIRDQVLDNAEIAEGDVVLDLGTGDGLVGLGALARVGRRGRVIFNDISQHLLDVAKASVQAMGALDQAEFVQAPAERLRGIGACSVDVVTARAVLIHIEAKRTAFRHAYRVLKPGGRLSICEPISSFVLPEPPNLFRSYDITPIRDLAEGIQELYNKLQPDEEDPMLDFDEIDLLNFAERAGFKPIYLDLKIAVQPRPASPWETFLHTADSPDLPTLAEAMDQVFSPDEAEAFADYLRPLVEAGDGMLRKAVAFLRGTKPL